MSHTSKENVMGISPAGAAASTTATSSTKSAAQAAASPSFAEISKLAVAPSDTVTLSAQAKSLMQEQGIAPALALLGN